VRTRRVLIVDDEADIREIVALSLEVGGDWVVEAVGDGHEAVRAAGRTRPDVVLLDVMMPGLDGPQTLRLLRADPATSDIPVIFLTAKVLLAEQRQLQDLGVCGLVSKPFDPMTLAAQVAALLEVSM
jgi:CheY-like chemotaxis protein